MDTALSPADQIGAVIDAMYAMISGPKGPRDWEAQARLFHEGARQMRTGLSEDGQPWIKIMGPAAYRADVEAWFNSVDFYEVEIGRRIDVFGNMAHVWSAYEARNSLDSGPPERRGINSIQLYRGGDGAWRIMSMIWDNERPGLTLPSIG